MPGFDPTVDYCYVTTVGRVTGKPHTVEIWFAAVCETMYVLAGGGDRGGERADFVRNARKVPGVTVRIGKRTSTKRDAIARAVKDKSEDALARRLLLEKYASYDDLDEWGRTAMPIAFDLHPEL